jgi:hypothetical protein
MGIADIMPRRPIYKKLVIGGKEEIKNTYLVRFALASACSALLNQEPYPVSAGKTFRQVTFSFRNFSTHDMEEDPKCR